MQILYLFRPPSSHSHACVSRFVDDDGLAGLVYVVIHAKVGRHAVQQHAVVRRHLGELLVLVTVRESIYRLLGERVYTGYCETEYIQESQMTTTTAILVSCPV